MLCSQAYEETLRAQLPSGDSFAVCRRKAVAALAGEETASLLDRPNNNLGIEYCRAIQRTGAAMQVLTVPRRGADHDGATVDGIASASHIRGLLLSGETEEALALMPEAAAQVLRRELAAGRSPASLQHCERSVLYRLRQMGEGDFAPYDGIWVPFEDGFPVFSPDNQLFQ